MKQLFLVVTERLVIDQDAVEEVPAVPRVPAVKAVKDADGNIITPAVPAVPAVPKIPAVAAVTHNEVHRCHVEDSAEQVARLIADPTIRPMTSCYSIKFTAANKPMIKTLREKARKAAPAKQTVTIEDQDGNELGSAEV